MSKSLPRGIRNNNAGNIRRHVGNNWQGLSETQTDKEFCQFKGPEWGLRAIVRTLFTYQNKYGLKSVRAMINRYAPPNENNTEGYIKRVCTELGVAPTQDLELTDEVLSNLLRAIVAVENGQQYYDYYSDELISKAINLAVRF